jgi:PEP-CTERM motif
VSKSLGRLVATLLFCMAGAIPADAASITIDSANCSTPAACYGLSWTLTINTQAGGYTYNGTNYDYQAFLDVKDDAAVSGTPSVTISAVDFKVNNVMSAAVLYQVPTSTVLGTWTTSIDNLSSGGCQDSSANFVCSQSTADPANFAASTTNQRWAWYFDAPALFAGLEGAHIGAKMVPIGTPGKLLSQEFHKVPEPGSVALFAVGAAVAFSSWRARRRSATV